MQISKRLFNTIAVSFASVPPLRVQIGSRTHNYLTTQSTLIAMASSSISAKGKEPVGSGSCSGLGSGDESRCRNESGYKDDSESEEFPSFDTPP